MATSSSDVDAILGVHGRAEAGIKVKSEDSGSYDQQESVTPGNLVLPHRC